MAKTQRRYKGDKTRRFRWLEECAAAGVSHGAYRWGGQLAQQSNAVLTKTVYGMQTGQAEKIGRSDRMVRHYRKELEDAGLIETIRSEPERRADGTFTRVFTNVYRFVVRPLQRKKSTSDRPETDFRYNPSLTREIQTLPSEQNRSRGSALDDPSIGPPPDSGEASETGDEDQAADKAWSFDLKHIEEARRHLQPASTETPSASQRRSSAAGH